MAVEAKDQKHDFNCMLCGEELEYTQDYKEVSCVYCKEKFESNCTCSAGHYVCDTCHSMSGLELIHNYCKNTDKTNPLEMAIELMNSESVNMHGPEHHFLVPAVLVTSYYNIKGDEKEKLKKLAVAKKRGSAVPGGVCGFYGSCGAAVGTGIFISIITGATPTTKESWGLANKMTATSLMSMADVGGPRCCKRNSYIAIEEAAKFVEENFGVKIYDYEGEVPKCTFRAKNKECIKQECKFF